MRHGTWIALSTCAVLSVWASAEAIQAQSRDTAFVPSAVVCTTCRITLTNVVTLGGPDDQLSAADWIHNVVRDSRGRYYLAPTANFALIAVYDDKGKFLKTLGGKGQGPGEFDFIVDAKVKSDSLFILDQGAQRVTILTPDHAVARTVRLQGTFTGLELLAEGSFLTVGTKGNPATSTNPLFRFSRDGELIGAFGGNGVGVQRGRVAASDRRFRATQGGTHVLVSHLDRYQVELRRADGTLLKTFKRSAEWYEPWTDYTIRPFDMLKPKPMTRAVWQDSAGLMWTMNQVSVPNWKPARTYVPGREEPFIPFDVTDSYAETIFEVIDPVSGGLVASQQFPQYMQNYIGDGLVYTLRVVDDDLRIDVWRVTLTGYK